VSIKCNNIRLHYNTVHKFPRLNSNHCRYWCFTTYSWSVFPSVLPHCWLGDRKGIWPVKNLGVGLLTVTFWLELCMSYNNHLLYP